MVRLGEFNLGPLQGTHLMNEQIKVLAIDCAGQMEWDAPKNPEYFTFNRDELQKFAELIIRECIDLALGSSHREDDMGAIVANKIKEHFGVSDAT